MIKKVRDQGISILVIEHVMKAIQSLSDRLLVLHHGEKIAEGKPEEVLEQSIKSLPPISGANGDERCAY